MPLIRVGWALADLLVMCFQEAIALRKGRYNAALKLFVPNLVSTMLDAVEIERKNVLLPVIKWCAGENKFQALLKRVVVDVKDVVVHQKARMAGLGEVVE